MKRLASQLPIVARSISSNAVGVSAVNLMGGRRGVLAGGRKGAALRFIFLLPLHLAVSWPLPAGALAPERATQIDAMLSGFEQLAMFNGIVIVDLAGERVFERAYGLADYETKVPITADTRFRIASLSKNMTDAAVAVLVQRGELDLTGTLDRYLPEFPGAAGITLQHLLSHQSGIAHTNRFDWGDGKQSLALDAIVARLQKEPLDFAPGTKRQYSNGGYAVLSKVLQLVTGRSLWYVDAGTGFCAARYAQHRPCQRFTSRGSCYGTWL